MPTGGRNCQCRHGPQIRVSRGPGPGARGPGPRLRVRLPRLEDSDGPGRRNWHSARRRGSGCQWQATGPRYVTSSAAGPRLRAPGCDSSKLLATSSRMGLLECLTLGQPAPPSWTSGPGRPSARSRWGSSRGVSSNRPTIWFFITSPNFKLEELFELGLDRRLDTADSGPCARRGSWA
jgi:hypothetical protein